MAELILRLRVDPETGRREVVVDYASDGDALPIEHEEEHRRLAAGIVDGGLANPQVEVRRDHHDPLPPTAEGPGEEPPVAEPAKTRG